MNLAFLIAVLIQVESGGRPGMIGDEHLSNKAYGVLQIRKPCLDDVNEVMGHELEKPLTLEDVRKSEPLSRWVCVQYLRRWGANYRRKTGKEPTYEVFSRIWNGGPNGWKKNSTLAYWSKVEVLLERTQEEGN